MKKIFSLIISFLLIQSAYSQSAIKGKVSDKDGPSIGAACFLYKDSLKVKAITTDFDGNYFFTMIEPGEYDIEIELLGYTKQRITGINVIKDSTVIVDVQLEVSTELLNEICIVAYRKPIISFDCSSSASTVSAQDIKSSPLKNVQGLSATSSGLSSDNNGNVNVRGVRKNATNYYVDGIRVVDKNVNRRGLFKKKRAVEPQNFDKIVENKFISSRMQPLSTLSIDVDRASYSTVRRYLNQGSLPPIDAVRIEEMINYFDYDRSTNWNKINRPFNTQTTLTDCPWNKESKILHVKIDGKQIEKNAVPPTNLVFLIDVSGSMNDPNKLPLLVSSFKLLVNQLREEDKVAIVVYAGAAGCVLESTPGSEKIKILDALNKLRAGGSTAGAAGIEQAYKIAKENFIEEGNNRVVLATDGDFNVGISDDNSLIKLIENKREDGIFLSILGFGSGNYKDGKMQKLADSGNGNHSYIDNMQEAQKVFTKEFTGTLFAIAKDVKIQIEFNPAIVKNYRMIGYENRILAAEDFNDDTKDAGELGAGHQVTVMYELDFEESDTEEYNIDPLKYSERKLIYSPELATIKYRYKEPDAKKSVKSEEIIINTTVKWDELSDDTKWAMSVAEFGMLLRKSDFSGSSGYKNILSKIETLADNSGDSYKDEFVSLVEIAMVLDEEAYAKK